MGTAMFVVHVLIVSLSPQTCQMTAPLQGASVSRGCDIDVSGVDGSVDLEWQLGPQVRKTFMPVGHGAGPVTITPANGQFDEPTLSADGRMLTVFDDNTANVPNGYGYRLHFIGGNMDPRIINKGG